MTSSLQSGSITSQLVEVFTSHGNAGSSIDDIGKSQFDDLAACEAALGKSTSDLVDPAQLPGREDGLADTEGIPVSVAGTILAPACEPGLANGERLTMLFSWSPAVCCWVKDGRLSALSAFVFVSFLGLVYGGSDVPSDGPLLRVILLLEDIFNITSYQ